MEEREKKVPPQGIDEELTEGGEPRRRRSSGVAAMAVWGLGFEGVAEDKAGGEAADKDVRAE